MTVGQFEMGDRYVTQRGMEVTILAIQGAKITDSTRDDFGREALRFEIIVSGNGKVTRSYVWDTPGRKIPPSCTVWRGAERIYGGVEAVAA